MSSRTYCKYLPTILIEFSPTLEIDSQNLVFEYSSSSSYYYYYYVFFFFFLFPFFFFNFSTRNKHFKGDFQFIKCHLCIVLFDVKLKTLERKREGEGEGEYYNFIFQFQLILLELVKEEGRKKMNAKRKKREREMRKISITQDSLFNSLFMVDLFSKCTEKKANR